MKRKIMMLTFFSASLLFIGAKAARADGELMVIPMVVKVFNSHESTVNVRNTGDAPMYLTVKVQKVTNPGIMPEIKVPLSELPKPGIIASPDKLTLGPNQSRDIRLMSLMEPQQEGLYRLYIEPVRTLKVHNAPKDKITAPLSMSIGYGVLVRHMPAPGKQHASLTHQCGAGEITLQNTGNVRMVLSEMKRFSASGTALNSAKDEKIAIFPGTPQTLKASKLTFKDEDNKPASLSCP